MRHDDAQRGCVFQSAKFGLKFPHNFATCPGCRAQNVSCSRVCRDKFQITHRSLTKPRACSHSIRHQTCCDVSSCGKNKRRENSYVAPRPVQKQLPGYFWRTNTFWSLACETLVAFMPSQIGNQQSDHHKHENCAFCAAGLINTTKAASISKNAKLDARKAGLRTVAATIAGHRFQIQGKTKKGRRIRLRTPLPFCLDAWPGFGSDRKFLRVSNLCSSSWVHVLRQATRTMKRRDSGNAR